MKEQEEERKGCCVPSSSSSPSPLLSSSVYGAASISLELSIYLSSYRNVCFAFDILLLRKVCIEMMMMKKVPMRPGRSLQIGGARGDMRARSVNSQATTT